ncbi:gamma-glutamyltransferase [Pseudidiomarina mangrovi]|uniref:gamma-glutamyltransferase n=1 Tax=Pseudidiomarina mangrovi TaxID=2487133 RepID=UPI000FC9C703|nr:gamma-glutamyltransferase [Pseudidiomarina mangrovi]
MHVRLISLSLVVVAVASIIGCSEQSASNDVVAPEAATGFVERQGQTSNQYMVAAATRDAADAGAKILAQGGTAIDAAVAVQAMLTLTEPQSSGIGGGAFILYWDNTAKRLTTIDARERAPLAATPELFLDGQGQPPKTYWDAIVGGRSVGTPGVLKGLEMAHQRWGKVAWSELFTDTIALAETGFTVSPRLHQLLAMNFHPGLRSMQPAADYFYPNGEPLQAGQLRPNPEYAAVLKRVAAEGSSAFYSGGIAEAMVQAVQTSAISPGLLSMADLAEYEALEREPICAAYRTVYEICSMGPPSSGGITVVQMLGILEHTPIADAEPMSVDAVHYFTQAARLAYADRNRYIGDADFVEVPVAQMLNKEYLRERAQLIGDSDMGKAQPGEFGLIARADDQALEIPSTSHFAIIDSYGNAVSMTTTIEMGFGSGVMVNGYLLNNQLTDFSLVPEVDGRLVANRVEAGKRPRSSMSPTIVFNNETQQVMHVVGSPGGPNIINYVAQTLVAVLDWELDMQAAMALPHVTNLNNFTSLEQSTTITELQQALEQKGHEVRVRDLNSGLHGISVLADGRLFGGADPRREGAAVGN